MALWMASAAAIAVAYLFGSTPTGYLAGKLLRGMLAALTIALICGLEQPLPYRLMVIAGGICVVVLHRTNIQRLLAGTEPRQGQGARP
ncbi:MAG: hypothetical protein KF889_25725 [Alphaproteobacteria bacterium]|nr:hypothetical protein [Alphaproteobacteria bacterium]MCW5739605.1 hypothetical protein [Alphaproteobacteria bacterium]